MIELAPQAPGGCRRPSTPVIALLAALTLGAPSAWAAAADGEALRLRPVGSVTLDKADGRIDQVVATPDGGLIVRDADYWQEETQSIEKYDRAGKLERTIGRYGRGPGEFYRLKQVEMDDRRQLWVVDVMGRLSRFDGEGRLLGTQLIQRPGYQPTSLALDPSRGYFYLGGCLPTQTYLDLGCELVHRYRLEDGRYLGSYLATDEEALKKHLLALEDYLVEVAADGTVFAADVPLARVFKIDPDSGTIEVFGLPIDGMIPPTIVPGSGREARRAAYLESFLIDRLAIVGDTVLVSIREPVEQGGYRLVALGAAEGAVRPLTGVPEGRLVGTSPRGTLFFVRHGDAGFEVSEYRLEPDAGGTVAAR